MNVCTPFIYIYAKKHFILYSFMLLRLIIWKGNELCLYTFYCIVLLRGLEGSCDIYAPVPLSPLIQLWH